MPVLKWHAWNYSRDFTAQTHGKIIIYLFYTINWIQTVYWRIWGAWKKTWLWRHLCVSFNRLRSTTNSENAHRIYVIIILVNFSIASIWRCKFGNAMARCESRLLFIWSCWINEPYDAGEVKCPFSKIDMSIEEACEDFF